MGEQVAFLHAELLAQVALGKAREAEIETARGIGQAGAHQALQAEAKIVDALLSAGDGVFHAGKDAILSSVVSCWRWQSNLY